MILKSFEIENNIQKVLKYKFVLIYGENIGLKEYLKKKLINLNNKSEIINLFQEDIVKNKDIISNEVKNVSLFTENKTIIVNQINEKIISEIENLLVSKENIKIILIGDLLDKRSKLRTLFEKNNDLAIIPCYNDTEITLRRLIQNELKDFKKLDSNTINKIINYSNLDRKTIQNNILKINSFYDKKIITEQSLEILLNADRNELFENIRDAALVGDKERLNNLLDRFVFANEDAYLYLNMINFRLTKILDIHKQNTNNQNLELVINKMRPPIFWKDKPLFLKLLKKWDKQKVIEALAFLGKIERRIKSNSSLNGLTLIKNSITNICTNSWVCF